MKWHDLHVPRLEYHSGESSWAGHLAFALTLTKITAPRIFVELGAYRGDSYLAFCQSVRDNGLPTRCFAVDTWRGDAHTLLYSEEVYQTLRRQHDRRYGAFSQLLRMEFDQAVHRFKDGSVDLLHIDGLHTYDAVRHDFETWLPKVSTRGVVVLHDTCEHRADFGVFRFWEEVSARYPSFNFTHSHGLGVLCVGAEPPATVRALCEDHAHASAHRLLFARLSELLVQESTPPGNVAFPPNWSRPKDRRIWSRVRREFQRGIHKLRRIAAFW